MILVTIHRLPNSLATCYGSDSAAGAIDMKIANSANINVVKGWPSTVGGLYMFWYIQVMHL